MSDRPLRGLGFVTIGSFDEQSPFAGHEETLQLIERAEDLGFDNVWVRERHLQPGISSPLTVLAAASQRTRHIKLGTAVIPLGAENPFRLAEDLATVDVLSQGRLVPGISAGPPIRYETYRDSIYPNTWQYEDFSYDRFEHLLALLRGQAVSEFDGRDGIERFVRRVQPHVPGLAERVWVGSGSQGSAAWAGRHELNLMTSNVIHDEEANSFSEAQARIVERFYEAHPEGTSARASQGLVVLPTDSATPAQRARYEAYVHSREDRTRTPQGARRKLYAPDLLGSSQEIAEQLRSDPGYAVVDEVVFALPFEFAQDDYVQLITDIATNLGPLLGWSRSY